MKSRENPKYSIWQNICFMVQTAWTTHKSVLILCVVNAVIQVVLNLTQLFATPEILSRLEQRTSIRDLLWTIGFFSIALFLLQGMKSYFTTLRLPAEIDIRAAITRKMARKTCETSYPNIHDPRVLKLQDQALQAANTNQDAAEHIWRTLTELLTNIVGFLLYLFLLSHLNPFLILLVIVTSAAGFFVSKYIHEWEYRHREEKETCDRELNYFLTKPREITIAKDIRIFGLGSWLRELRIKSMHLLSAFLTRREKIYIWADVTDIAMTFLRNGMAYAYLIWQTLQHGWSASEFLLYFTAVSGFTTWVTGILSEFSQLHKESLALSRIQEYLNLPEPFRFENGITPPAADGYELKLEDVSFHYPGTSKDILKHLNLTIRPGEKLAIVGLNGAGKTTLVMLLCGFYDPSEGRVLLNGRDIRDFNRRQYYDLFSAVFQDFSILDTTIAECVAQTATDIDMVKVSDCLDKAGLTAAIAKLPDGANTHFGREVYLDGVLLSGGQMQRLMLARALYKDGPILVLDEPTSALDPIAENDIYKKYSEMTAGKTSLFISHRLASTRFCDRIIFVADGKILEEGTHEELLKKKGAYAELFQIQSRYYQEGEEHEEKEN